MHVVPSFACASLLTRVIRHLKSLVRFRDFTLQSLDRTPEIMIAVKYIIVPPVGAVTSDRGTLRQYSPRLDEDEVGHESEDSEDSRRYFPCLYWRTIFFVFATSHYSLN